MKNGTSKKLSLYFWWIENFSLVFFQFLKFYDFQWSWIQCRVKNDFFHNCNFANVWPGMFFLPHLFQILGNMEWWIWGKFLETFCNHTDDINNIVQYFHMFWQKWLNFNFLNYLLTKFLEKNSTQKLFQKYFQKMSPKIRTGDTRHLNLGTLSKKLCHWTKYFYHNKNCFWNSRQPYKI